MKKPGMIENSYNFHTSLFNRREMCGDGACLVVGARVILFHGWVDNRIHSLALFYITYFIL
jgi:hypothetical protein